MACVLAGPCIVLTICIVRLRVSAQKLVLISSRVARIYVRVYDRLVSYRFPMCLMIEGLSNTPKLSPMDEGHEQPDSPEVSFRETLGNMQQSIELRRGWKMSGKRTRSDPVERGC